MESPDLIIPSQIPWSELKAKELEELLYWLLDSMGAKNLEWRIGGSGDGTADQGRDLECFFHMSAPDGELAEQKWWVDAKGRAKTVNPTDVKETVLNAAGKPNIDVLLIATNTNFSNPTRDWVKEFQIKYPKPVVKLWERTELENYCSKYPLATIRLFSKALSPQGKIEVARSRLWNYAKLTDEPTLEALWQIRKEVEISPEALLALVVSECANGDITKRSWAMDASELNLVTALVNFLMNCFYIIFRSSENGVKQEPFIRAIAYLVLCCIDRRGAEKTASLLKDWTQFDDRNWPDEVKNFILGPVLDTLVGEMRDVCISDCSRVSGDNYSLTEQEVKKYWNRLKVTEVVTDEQKRLFSMEATKKECKVGFCVNEDIGCPVNGNKKPEADITKTIHEVARIAMFRKFGAEA